MKKFKFKINGQQFDVEVNDFEEKSTVVSVNGTEYEVEVEHEVKKVKTPTLARKAVVNKPGEAKIKKSAANAGGFKVEAPLPGSIFKINVAVGDTVNEGDTLLIMEAMKMENNVLAEKSGTVSDIKISVGESVLQNDILLTIS